MNHGHYDYVDVLYSEVVNREITKNEKIKSPRVYQKAFPHLFHNVTVEIQDDLPTLTQDTHKAGKATFTNVRAQSIDPKTGKKVPNSVQ